MATTVSINSIAMEILLLKQVFHIQSFYTEGATFLP